MKTQKTKSSLKIKSVTLAEIIKPKKLQQIEKSKPNITWITFDKQYRFWTRYNYYK